MANLFHIIPEAQAILLTKGVFKQAKVYRRGNRIYAQWGSGFIRLGGRDATSCPGVSYESLDLPADIAAIVSPGPTREPLLQLDKLPEACK
jgi:hypothetical protein